MRITAAPGRCGVAVSAPALTHLQVRSRPVLDGVCIGLG